jgi:hypothetical protein
LRQSGIRPAAALRGVEGPRCTRCRWTPLSPTSPGTRSRPAQASRHTMSRAWRGSVCYAAAATGSTGGRGPRPAHRRLRPGRHQRRVPGQGDDHRQHHVRALPGAAPGPWRHLHASLRDPQGQDGGAFGRPLDPLRVIRADRATRDGPPAGRERGAPGCARRHYARCRRRPGPPGGATHDRGGTPGDRGRGVGL